MNKQMEALPETPVPAMAYVPWQTLQELYEPEAALAIGTLFPELNKPLTAGGMHHG